MNFAHNPGRWRISALVAALLLTVSFSAAKPKHPAKPESASEITGASVDLP